MPSERTSQSIDLIKKATEAETTGDVIKKAVAVYRYFMEALQGGAVVTIIKDDQVNEVVFDKKLTVTGVANDKS